MNIFNQTYQLSKEKKYNTSMKKFFFFIQELISRENY